MPDNTTDYTFYDYRKPQLEDGEYTVNVSQGLTVHDYSTSQNNSPSIPSKILTFHVDGPKFDLDPSLVESVYPPIGGKGDYMANLPSITLNRSTLPWERLPGIAKISGNSASWLFLLLVDETENDKVTENNGIDLSTVKNLFFNPVPPGITHYPNKINYLTLDNTMAPIFPKLGDLEYLSYARLHGTDTNDEKAILLCNRLPQMGHNSTVYLVSLEGAYTGANDAAGHPIFSGLKDGSKLVMPYLYKWQFHAFSDELFEVTADTVLPSRTPSLGKMLDHVYTTKDEFEDELEAHSVNIDDYAVIEKASKLKGANFHDVLANLSGGFEPLCLGGATGIVSTGSVSLPYRKGNMLSETVDAWYRGPFTATTITPIDSKFPLHSDNSIPLSPESLFLSDGSQEDTTYAAAFELGKLTALADSYFCNEFYKWKSETATAIRLKKIKETSGYKNILHLPISDVPTIKDIPTHVTDKFDDWKKLKGIPYRYLVPNSALLPNESIRFFKVDNTWINAFITGAFSIGKTVDADLTTYLSSQLLTTAETYYGFLINSLIVSAWPEYEVDVYTKIHATIPDPPLTGIQPIRRDNLDVNVQLYLFSEEFKQLNFHLHAAKKHNGFLYEEGHYKKGAHIATINTNHTFDISSLKTEMRSASIAQFASEIMEGTPGVLFNIT